MKSFGVQNKEFQLVPSLKLIHSINGSSYVFIWRQAAQWKSSFPATKHRSQSLLGVSSARERQGGEMWRQKGNFKKNASFSFQSVGDCKLMPLSVFLFSFQISDIKWSENIFIAKRSAWWRKSPTFVEIILLKVILLKLILLKKYIAENYTAEKIYC